MIDLKERFSLRCVVFVGNRGMLSEDKLEFILEHDLGFIVCHRLRKNNEIKALITDTDTLDTDPEDNEEYREEVRNGVKFVMAHDPYTASLVLKRREVAMEAVNFFIPDVLSRVRRAQEWKTRGRLLSPEGVLTQVRYYLKNTTYCFSINSI